MRIIRLALACVLVLSGLAAAAPIEPKDVRVIDGDTIRIFQKRPNVRLVGFNAPELAAPRVIRNASWGARPHGESAIWSRTARSILNS